MFTKRTIGVLICMFFSAQSALADAPLKGRLGLDTDQAKVVAEIQAKHRDAMRGERGELHREERKLRRARSANDSELIAEQEVVVDRLREVMRQRILSEDNEIRGVLTPEQLTKFEVWIKERNNMVGSSRDVRVLKQ